MWPMVAGIGPLLGDGVFGYFIDPTGLENVLEYRDGASSDNGVIQQRVDAPYRVRRRLPRVAVLTDNATASSGEATALAFRGRPDARSFGMPTCGLSTAVENYPMSDGAMLNLAISVMADRTRAKYGANVAPDEILPDPQQTVDRAVQWLQTGS
jgi:C-terminal processing protease CtpA/Prc